MIIKIQDEVLEFENDPKITKQILNEINEYLEKRELMFSHLIIDGFPVYENIDTYFNDNIKSIDRVEVVIQTMNELVNEAIQTVYKYIVNAIPLITELAEEFYQQPNQKTWTKLNDLFEGIQWIIETLTRIDSIKNLSEIVCDYNVWNEYVQGVSQLSIIIQGLEEVIIEKDIISIGDMLLYEITPIFESLLDKLGFLLPKIGENSVS